MAVMIQQPKFNNMRKCVFTCTCIYMYAPKAPTSAQLYVANAQLSISTYLTQLRIDLILSGRFAVFVCRDACRVIACIVNYSAS